LKFSDVIIAVASLFLVAWFIDTLLNFMLIPASPSYGGDIAYILSVLVSGLIVGFVFAGKLREESRLVSVGKVVVLLAVTMMLIVLVTSGPIGHYNAWADENLTNMYGKTATSSWTNAEWYWYEMALLTMVTSLYAVYTLLFGFIGLYLGSMRKPSTKTTE
jgi:flagellar biosynthesis protein FliQ